MKGIWRKTTWSAQFLNPKAPVIAADADNAPQEQYVVGYDAELQAAWRSTEGGPKDRHRIRALQHQRGNARNCI
eukprot:8318603-Alexandrium_andersonii.AAC.1